MQHGDLEVYLYSSRNLSKGLQSLVPEFQHVRRDSGRDEHW